MSDDRFTATRWPINFENVQVLLRGKTPEGIEMLIEVPTVALEPGALALIEVKDNSIEQIDDGKRIGPPRMFMLDLRGTMLPSPKDGSLYQVSVDQPEDIERIATQAVEPEPDTAFPKGWRDPRDWS